MTQPWTAPEIDRPQPAQIAGERASLEQWLDFERATLQWKCAGLTPEQLVLRAVPPSSMSLIGLVRHMADVERWWFRMHAGYEDLPHLYWADGQDDADFDDVNKASAEADFAQYLTEIDAARAAVAPRELDDVVPSRGHHPERTRDIRWIYVHMIEEYARHNGHADLLRELVDGATGE